MKKTLLTVISMMVVMSANAQNFGYGITAKKLFAEKHIEAPSFQFAYELQAQPCFGLEAAFSVGGRFADAEATTDNRSCKYGCLMLSADADIYFKLHLNRLQIISGVGCAYRQSMQNENLYPTSGITASAGLGYSLINDESGRFDIKALSTLAPLSDSGKKVFSPGVEVSLTYYFRPNKKASVFY